jgi:hypothetical protein
MTNAAHTRGDDLRHCLVVNADKAAGLGWE